MAGQAAIVGTAQYKPARYGQEPPVFALDQVADLAAQAIADAGLKPDQIDGLAL